MEELKSFCMSLYFYVSIFTPCIIWQIIMLKLYHKKATVSHLVWAFVFILYLGIAIKAAGPGTIWDIGKFGDIIRPEEINLIPFQSEGSLTYILNMVMFAPLGFLLPLIWDKYQKLWPTIAAGATFSILIELCQLFNRRKTDVDDLIMNLLGVIIGFGLWKIFSRLFKTKRKGNASLSQIEPIYYIFLAMLGRFFLHNWRYLAYLLYS